MKIYNKPQSELIAIALADCVTSSVTVKEEGTGGAVWDWSLNDGSGI